MKQVKTCLLIAVLAVSSSGCMLMEKGVRLNASMGLEGYSDHEDKITVKPDTEPFICKAYGFAFCNNKQPTEK